MVKILVNFKKDEIFILFFNFINRLVRLNKNICIVDLELVESVYYIEF